MAYRCLVFLLLIAGGLGAQELPEDFYDITYLTELDNPMGLTFDENGRMYVWEKKGVVRVADTAGNVYPEPLSINLYPNPVRDAFTLELLEVQAGEVRLELLDETGRTVLEKVWETTVGQPFNDRVLPGQLPNGAYFYRLTNGEQRHYGQLILLK
jgi:hypothetical protein